MPEIIRTVVVRVVATAIVLACATLVAHGADAPRSDLAPLFAELNALATPNYTGGLPSRNRALAERIHAAMLEKFPPIECPSAAGEQNFAVRLTYELEADDPPLVGLDDDLTILLRALSNPRQEIRDTAVYAIGLLGPSAKDAVPFLLRRFAGRSDPKRAHGDWVNDAYGKLTCESIVAPDFSQVIPRSMLPPFKPFGPFLRKSAVIMANLYLDEDIEYPPGMMAYAYTNYAMVDHAEGAAPLFPKILSNKKLSRQKHLEVAEILMRVKPKDAKPSLDVLLSLTDTSDRQLKYFVAEALFNLNHDAAIPLLSERIAEDWHWGWEKLCTYGPRARAAEKPLLALLADEKRWPTDIRAGVKVLGCIKSSDAVPVMLPMLAFPDWVMQRDIAKSLGEIGARTPAVEEALTSLARTHWSRRVRTAAELALRRLYGAPPPPPPPVPAAWVVSTGGSFAIDHGLPWCDASGKYSIDGKSWFSVTWTDRGLTQLPPNVPDGPFNLGGVIWLERVDDGWIHGADIGEFGGGLWHVSDTGVATQLELREHTNIRGIFKNPKGIFSFGRQIAINGDSGVLWLVARNAGGQWQSTRIATLPSVPTMFAGSPGGDLLLSDEANTYAVINGEVVPLRCEKVHAGSYFTDDHPTYFDPD